MKIRKVVCINSYLNIKYGKVYDHIDYDEGIAPYISIIDDTCKEFAYLKSFFISLEKWREDKLKELGI